jgi:predicted double-glycine peptidase
MSKILEVPYKSQWDNDATTSKNDCGPCSLAMVLKYLGVDVATSVILEKTGAGTGYVSFQQLQKVASEYGFSSRIERNRTPQRIKDLIDQGIPPIVVVHYGYLSSRQDQGFAGGHIMVAVGYRDDGYFINDPDFWGNYRAHGDHHFYTKEEFEKSWEKSTEDGNASNTLFFLQPKENPTEPTIPSGDDEYASGIKNYLVSIGYTYSEAHLKVIKELHKSDLNLKSGDYILKEDCTKEKEDLKTKHKEEISKLKSDFKTEKKEAIEDALKEAKKEWKVEDLESQVAEYEKIVNSTAYKIAKTVNEILEAINIIKKLGGK